MAVRNLTMLMGACTRDAEGNIVMDGDKVSPKSYSRITLAVRRDYKDANGEYGADFISCVAFGRLAKFLMDYAKKGTQLLVQGSIQTGSYTNKDGQKVYTTDVRLSDVTFAGKKPESNSNGSSSNSGSSGNSGYTDAGDGFMNIPDGIDEELPFN